MKKIKRDQWHQLNEDHSKHTKNQFQHNNLWPFSSTPINKALSILERLERWTKCKQEFYEEPEMYLKNLSLRGAPLACKASPNVSETPKSLRTSSLHSLRPLTKRNPPKTPYKIPSPWFHIVPLSEKEEAPSNLIFFLFYSPGPPAIKASSFFSPSSSGKSSSQSWNQLPY